MLNKIFKGIWITCAVIVIILCVVGLFITTWSIAVPIMVQTLIFRIAITLIMCGILFVLLWVATE